MHATKGEKVFVMDISKKGLLFKIHKEPSQFKNVKIMPPPNWQKHLNTSSRRYENDL